VDALEAGKTHAAHGFVDASYRRRRGTVAEAAGGGGMTTGDWLTLFFGAWLGLCVPVGLFFWVACRVGADCDEDGEERQ
jgi:hypothetical protein